MSQLPATLDVILTPGEKDLGGFTVRRVLPSAKRRMVGPYAFFDHMGPAKFPVGEGVAVRPHPHIGISTVTYLFDGEIMHRDSLGFVKPIRPGAVNFMTAGRGIVHSERTAPEEKAKGASLHGIQLWLALPVELEETEPAFTHYPAADIPSQLQGSLSITLIIGEAFGMVSPVAALQPTLYVDLHFGDGADIVVPACYEERAIYLVQGEAALDGQSLSPGQMAVIREGAEPLLLGQAGARLMLIGGAAYPEPRTVWWNFVSHSKARIEQAKDDWREGRFEPVPGETEFIPLPED